eukprot:TRINITY_DN1210_c0_g1_i1.p1 TRINITY_DN1210_c0_g1~~TRINITY_DN1210_c0_g1_i1.p1  ORF type:complete len:228 (+),score=26.76 TRINITY_DN1210_c0_g1_i1:486-1169(+)
MCQGLLLGLGIVDSLVLRYSWGCSTKENAWWEFYDDLFLEENVLMATEAKSHGPIVMIVDSSLHVLEKRSGHGKYQHWFWALSVLQQQRSVLAPMLQKLWNLDTLSETKTVVTSLADVLIVETTRRKGLMFSSFMICFWMRPFTRGARRMKRIHGFKCLHRSTWHVVTRNTEDLQKYATTAAGGVVPHKVQNDGYIRDNLCRFLRNAGYGEQLLSSCCGCCQNRNGL